MDIFIWHIILVLKISNTISIVFYTIDGFIFILNMLQLNQFEVAKAYSLYSERG